MQVELSKGTKVEVEFLKLSQARRMATAADSKNAMDATVQACVDALNNANPGSWTKERFEDEFGVEEANELALKVFEISGLRMGEVAATA